MKEDSTKFLLVSQSLEMQTGGISSSLGFLLLSSAAEATNSLLLRQSQALFATYAEDGCPAIRPAAVKFATRISLTVVHGPPQNK